MTGRSSKSPPDHSPALQSIRTGALCVFFLPLHTLPRLGVNRHLPTLQICPRLGLCGLLPSRPREPAGHADPKASPRLLGRPARLSTPRRRSVPSLTGEGCTGLQENGRSLAMGVQGNLGAVSGSYRISCKGSNVVKEKLGLIELGTFRSCTRLSMTLYLVISSPQCPISYLTVVALHRSLRGILGFLSHMQTLHTCYYSGLIHNVNNSVEKPTEYSPVWPSHPMFSV